MHLTYITMIISCVTFVIMLNNIDFFFLKSVNISTRVFDVIHIDMMTVKCSFWTWFSLLFIIVDDYTKLT